MRLQHELRFPLEKSESVKRQGRFMLVLMTDHAQGSRFASGTGHSFPTFPPSQGVAFQTVSTELPCAKDPSMMMLP